MADCAHCGDEFYSEGPGDILCGRCFEIAELKAENERLKELIYDLRGYTRDWDWKYGVEWDKVMEELGIGSSTETVDAEG